MVTWGDLADRNLTLDYFERNGKRGYVPGEKLRIIPGVPILWYNCTYEWTGMQGGGSSLGIGCATTRGITLVDKDDNKKSVIIYITGYDSTTSKLYTRDDTGLIRVFNAR